MLHSSLRAGAASIQRLVVGKKIIRKPLAESSGEIVELARAKKWATSDRDT